MPRKFGLFLVLALAWAALAAGRQASKAAAEPLTWKPVENCVLRIDERPVKIWEVYLVPKKKSLVLIQLGSRFLQLDTDAKAIYEVAPEALQRKGRELIQKVDTGAAAVAEGGSPDPDLAKELRLRMQRSGERRALLPSADWTERDAGRARIIRLRLTEEGRRIEVQLPIAPDLRKVY